MGELKFYELKCRRCGGELEALSGGMYRCKSCGKAFKEQIVEDVADKLRDVLNEQKQEAVANLRTQLWHEMQETAYINSAKIVGLARDIKKYLPEDYFANFCEVANCGNNKEVNAFLNATTKEQMADYADVVLDFMLKSLKSANITAVSLFIENAFKGDIKNYDKYTTALEKEAEKVNNGIYDLILTRDVFLAYSSTDMPQVLELCDYLESNKITCFLALRNLRHGRGAVDNYDQALKTAIDNCKTVVFVSSAHSRDMGCDALTKELPYIRQKDIEVAPAEYKRAYDRLPAEYMMPRVEYLIEDYCGNVAEMVTKEFFHGLEWCKSKEAVAARITKYLTEEHETAAQRFEREKREYEQKLEETRREKEKQELEYKLKLAQLEKEKEEIARARIEAERQKEDEKLARQLEYQQKLEEARLEKEKQELEYKLKLAQIEKEAAEKRAKEEENKKRLDGLQAETAKESPAKEAPSKPSRAKKAAVAKEESGEDPNAIYCKKCRSANKYSAKFCSNCGGREFFASFDEYLASKNKYCTECGAQNDVNDKFCTECGSSTFVATEKEYKALVKKREQERLRKEKAIEALSTLGDYKDLGNGYAFFGIYPQSRKTDDVKIEELYDKERKYYLGSDGCLYAYRVKMSENNKIENQAYYKVEPVKWRVFLNGTDKLLVADEVLDAQRFGSKFNNYEKSEIRKFINGEFYEKVFNENQKSKILIKAVSNGLSSTGDKSNKYVCGQTKDKVFLLSRKEAEQYLKDNESRQRVGTDYAVAGGVFQDKINGKGCSCWWLRSPYADYSQGIYAQSVHSSGELDYSNVESNERGVVPAIRLPLTEEERKIIKEEERQRKIREEEERKRIEEEERKRKEEEECKRKEAERKRKEAEERKRKEAEERKRLEEEERKRLEEEKRKRKEEEERKRSEEKEKVRKILSNIGDYKDIGGGYITFGSYPKSKKSESVKIGQIIDQERSYYLGSDNNFYAKYANSYYMVEPIKWKVLYGGCEPFVVADNILDAHRFAESSSNYAKSEVRKFINSDFYNKAFTESQKDKIITKVVDNGLSSTGDSVNGYVCENTKDKVFLLSYKEAEQYLTDNESMKRVPTEYAIAKGVWQYTAADSEEYKRSGKGSGNWWLRSPYDYYRDQRSSERCGEWWHGFFIEDHYDAPNYAKKVDSRCSVVYSDVNVSIGVVPALRIIKEFDIQNGVLIKYNGKGDNVELPKDVTEIGEKAFDRFTDLKKLFIPKSVKKISIKAFDECSDIDLIFEDIVWGNAYLEEERKHKEEERLRREEEERKRKEEAERRAAERKRLADYEIKGGALIQYKGKGGDVVLPDEIKAIGVRAFYGCKTLKSVTMGDSVTEICSEAFFSCEALTTVNIGKNVTKMGADVFTFCFKLTGINVDSANKSLKSVDGNLYTYDGSKLIKYASGKTDTSFSIPKGVKSILGYAVSYCENLVEISIPDSVTSIGGSAFFSCQNVETITIPAGVTNMGKDALRCCLGMKTIYCEGKKPLFGLPSGWDKEWLGSGTNKCKAKVVWVK